MFVDTRIIVAVLACHWFCDFILQSRWIAKAKSSSMYELTWHVGIYTIAMMFMVALNTPLRGWPFLAWLVWNGGAHWVVDFFTSRAFKYLWPRSEYLAVSVYGLDQLLHSACLIWTLVPLCGYDRVVL